MALSLDQNSDNTMSETIGQLKRTTVHNFSQFCAQTVKVCFGGTVLIISIHNYLLKHYITKRTTPLLA